MFIYGIAFFKKKTQRGFTRRGKKVVFLQLIGISKERGPEKFQLVVGIFTGDDSFLEQLVFYHRLCFFHFFLCFATGNQRIMGIDNQLSVLGNIIQQKRDFFRTDFIERFILKAFVLVAFIG